MAWIPMIPEDEAEGELKEWYDRLRDPWGGVDDIMRIHSISLPTMKGHYELYQSAMTGNPDLSRKEREMIAIVVSSICLLYTSPSPRDVEESRMPSSA